MSATYETAPPEWMLPISSWDNWESLTEMLDNRATALVIAEEELEVATDRLVERAERAEAERDRYREALERISYLYPLNEITSIADAVLGADQ